MSLIYVSSSSKPSICSLCLSQKNRKDTKRALGLEYETWNIKDTGILPLRPVINRSNWLSLSLYAFLKEKKLRKGEKESQLDRAINGRKGRVIAW